MIEPGWYAVPTDPARGRYWDGSSWSAIDEERVGSFPPFREPTPDRAAPTMAYVAAPVGEPTLAMPVAPEFAVVDEVERTPPSARPVILGVALALVAALIALVLWLALRDNEPDPPHPCGSDISVTTWNRQTFTLDDGTRADWPEGFEPGSREALEQVCTAVLAFREAAQTTVPPSAPASTGSPTTDAPAAATTQPRAPTTVVLPPVTPLGAPAAIGHGLQLTVTQFNPAAAALIAQTSPTNPPPAGGRNYALVTFEIVNTGAQPVTPSDLGFRLVSGETAYQSRDDLTTPNALDLTQPIPPSAQTTGDVVFEIVSADADTAVLRATTSEGDLLLQLR